MQTAACLISEELNLFTFDSAKNLQDLQHQPSDVVKSLEAWYTTDFERRLGEIIQLLQTQIVEQTRARFSLELQSQIDSMQSQFEDSKRQWDSDRQAMQGEIENLRTQNTSSSVLEEIARTKETLQKNKLELEKLMAEDPFPFARIMRLKVECQNLEAYFTGLTFQVVKS